MITLEKCVDSEIAGPAGLHSDTGAVIECYINHHMNTSLRLEETM